MPYKNKNFEINKLITNQNDNLNLISKNNKNVKNWDNINLLIKNEQNSKIIDNKTFKASDDDNLTYSKIMEKDLDMNSNNSKNKKNNFRTKTSNNILYYIYNEFSCDNNILYEDIINSNDKVLNTINNQLP